MTPGWSPCRRSPTDSTAYCGPGLIELAERLRQPYVLIGGQMVHLHGAMAGRVSPRVTTDIDLVFDVRAQVVALKSAVRALECLGYRVDGMSQELLAHRYVRDDGMAVDLLAPDNLGPRADLTTSPPGRTIEVPGATVTLRNRVGVMVRYLDLSATVFVPSLGHAILSKCRAFLRDHPRPSRSTRSRHVEDVAFLASLVDDVDALDARPPNDLTVLDDADHYAWLRLGEFAEDGHLVWRQLRAGNR